MGILNFLGLRKENAAKQAANASAHNQRGETQKQKNPAANQDHCCGSCGGQGHGQEKGHS